jgi:hypothetical protein
VNNPPLMRSWIKVGKLVLAGAVALVAVSCGPSTQSRPAAAQQASDTDSIEDSGKHLSGEFVLSALEDAYRPKNASAPPQAVFSFDENGTFKRQDKSRVEEGTYLIGTRSEFVMYIEKVNGELLGSARVDRYAIIDQRGDSITLQSSPSKTLVLRKR